MPMPGLTPMCELKLQKKLHEENWLAWLRGAQGNSLADLKRNWLNWHLPKVGDTGFLDMFVNFSFEVSRLGLTDAQIAQITPALNWYKDQANLND